LVFVISSGSEKSQISHIRGLENGVWLMTIASREKLLHEWVMTMPQNVGTTVAPELL
jgi:hypothetical protein